jgi:hypothetical protein
MMGGQAAQNEHRAMGASGELRFDSLHMPIRRH